MQLQLGLYLILVWFLGNGLLFLVLNVTLTKAFNAQIACVSFGFPIVSRRFSFRELLIEFGLLPLNTSVAYLNSRNLDQYPTVMPNGKLFDKLELWQQLLMVYSYPIMLLLISLSTLGQSDFLYHIRTALPQFVIGAIQPLTYGQHLLQEFSNLLSISPLQAWGVLCSKFVPWYLIPFVGFPSMAAISLAYEKFNRGDLLQNVPGIVLLVFWLMGIVPFLGWLVAIFVFVTGLEG